MSWVRSALIIGMTLFPSTALLVAIPGEGLAQQRAKGVRVQGHAARNSGKRLALVIGNAGYKSAPLRNPVNDARAMTVTLRGLGFEVIALENANQSHMKRAIDEFGKKLRQQGGVGLFYYSGHGMQVKGRNYMIPVGAKVAGEADVEYEAVDAGRVLAKMDTAGNGMNIVILDACRNNPFARSFRAANNGLATMDAPSGTLIAYATAPGKVAADGDGRNGLYTEQLIRYMKQPGLTLESVFKKVRSIVRRKSGGRQIPWEASSLEGEFFFARAKGDPSSPIAKTQPRSASQPPKTIDAEETLWKTIEKSTDIDEFQDYLSAYPRGRFVVTARIKIRRLKKKEKLTDDLERQTRLNAGFTPTPPGRDKSATRHRRAGRIIAKGNLRGVGIVRDTVTRPSWKEPGTGMEFVLMPGGSFRMGCHPNAGRCDDDERPVRTVRLKAFWIGKYEVAQGEWKRIMGSNPSEFKQGDHHPVENLSWDDVQAFIRRLNTASRRKFRLPSEAQWEYACRAGGSGIRFGTRNGRLSPNTANYNKKRGSTTRVGSYPANRLGLYDMSGNVFEWVQPSRIKTSTPRRGVSIRKPPPSLLVLRGGGWFNAPRGLRCTDRVIYNPDFGHGSLGFRLVRVR